MDGPLPPRRTSPARLRRTKITAWRSLQSFDQVAQHGSRRHFVAVVLVVVKLGIQFGHPNAPDKPGAFAKPNGDGIR